MKTALILHGTPGKEEYFSRDYPSCSNSHWIPWLQKELLMNEISAQAPDMLNAYEPNYALWKRTFEQFMIDEESTLIGHSCGGGFLLRYFSENKKRVKRIILVAPWLNPFGEYNKEVERDLGDFFDFEIDPDLKNRCDLHMIYSDDDMEDIQVSVDIIQKKIPGIQSREFKNYGHFCFEDMGTGEFPELKDLVLKN